MQILQTPQFFPLSLFSKAHTKLFINKPLNPNFSLLFSSSSSSSSSCTSLKPPEAYASDEFPVDETFLDQFGPKDSETEDEARKRNWVERGWAPWEEILSPEADFARKSLNEGEEVPLKDPETIEAFKMLKPSYRKKKMKEMGLTEDEYYAKQFEIKGEILDPLETYWDGPLVVRHVAPRDWPPRDWEVDRKELEFIREAHKMMAHRVTKEEFDNVVREKEGMCLDRYKCDQDYYPGRRKRGKDYEEGMYELPFYYPGQICVGKVNTLHLHQGAFVDIGGVHDGWVPIKGNDWYGSVSTYKLECMSLLRYWQREILIGLDFLLNYVSSTQTLIISYSIGLNIHQFFTVMMILIVMSYFVIVEDLLFRGKI
ncbi:Protein PLASTID TRANSCRIPTIONALLY ACTIVE 10 [Bienertia sinuspersici]